ncbi:MAG: hypothetical protein ABSA53_07750 [Streptosporangiaceae bacterium]|jgi:hypothetical protein
MAQQRRAEHRTILVLDVEKFGDWRRTNAHQVTVRDGMYGALQRTFREAGIPWDQCHKEDRGDGVFFLAPPEIHKGLFAETFLLSLVHALHDHNLSHGGQERIRLRMALHAGEVNFDDHGVTGTALNQAFRLVDAPSLKAALAGSPGLLAVISSSWFYGEVITNSSACCPDMYRPVLVDVKETKAVGWVALPGCPGSAHGEHWRVRVLDRDGGIHGAGVLIGGRYVITAAHVITESLGLPPGARLPPGHVRLDLPMRPELGVRRAEIVFWRAARANGGGDLAGLSVTGPALPGIDGPALRRDSPEMPRIVRLHGYPAPDCGPGGLRVWARLGGYHGGERIPLSPVGDFGPFVTREYSGAGVVDGETGIVLGIALVDNWRGEGNITRMAPVEKIAAQWPLLERIVKAARTQAADGGPAGGTRPLTPGPPPRPPGGSPRLSPAELVPLIEDCLRVPELADARSRHTIVSELPLEVALLAPRSSVDRADLAAVLWACAQAPSALAEFRRQVARKAGDGNDLRGLLNDLSGLQARLLQ